MGRPPILNLREALHIHIYSPEQVQVAVLEHKQAVGNSHRHVHLCVRIEHTTKQNNSVLLREQLLMFVPSLSWQTTNDRLSSEREGGTKKENCVYVCSVVRTTGDSKAFAGHSQTPNSLARAASWPSSPWPESLPKKEANAKCVFECFPCACPEPVLVKKMFVFT